MSKITFRADDDLVERLEACDASKSEVMRKALRSYLDATVSDEEPSDADGVDAALADRVDELIERRLDAVIDDRVDEALDGRLGGPARRPAPAESARDVNVNVSLDGVAVDREAADPVRQEEASHTDREGRKTRTEGGSERPEPRGTRGHDDGTTCASCGENVPDDHVYCPNCGEKRSHRVFCECGDEIRSDWSFCPGCGRRTPAADVLDKR